MKLPVLLAILGVVLAHCIRKRKLLTMLESIILAILIVLGLPLIIMLIIAWCIITGSGEKWRQEKLKKFENTDDL